MIRYYDLVQYVKESHVNWDTDIFDVLRDFFNQYSIPPAPPSLPQDTSVQLEPKEFRMPEDGEFSIQDLYDLLS